MNTLPDSIQKAIEAFNSLPGIGPKSAQRLAFHLLRKDKKISEDIGMAIFNLKQNINICPECQNISNETICKICEDDSRDKTTICVVEQPLNIIALERGGFYKGVYHVLHGAISPVDGIGVDDLKIKELIERVEKSDNIKEIILATNPSTEGETTAMYIQKILAPKEIKITRIARGIPFGGDIEYTDEMTLGKAIEGRMSY